VSDSRICRRNVRGSTSALHSQRRAFPMLQAVLARAREEEMRRLSLWAPAHSPAALAPYRTAGFRETGNRRPLPTNPSLQVIEMECPL